MENTSYEKFENLLNENNVTAYKVAKNTGLGFSFFTKWKQGKTTPKLVTLQKIADYFGVSVSYFTKEIKTASVFAVFLFSSHIKNYVSSVATMYQQIKNKRRLLACAFLFYSNI